MDYGLFPQGIFQLIQDNWFASFKRMVKEWCLSHEFMSYWKSLILKYMILSVLGT